ncbi:MULTISPECIES: FUSC family protein [Burkholderiaceae]|uniref:Integral membrane bound transporter domain-containing protein n=1 Tax=Caballeronia sordidicola TaxID=196367 RepID=A0A242MN25_CABSO|nr:MULTISPECIES: FUSC family protein [Burkholderiaceae]OTP72719.1 hypothetical protein PAMC26577_20665 [Caballeronia sordidicola]
MSRLRDLHRESRKVAGRHGKAASGLLDSVARNRPVWMVSFAVSQADLSEGLRAAFASTVMLLLGNLLHMPEFSWAAIGAFWTCLADAAGSNRMRFASMSAFALLSTVCGGLTAYASGSNIVAAAVAVFVFSGLGALARIWGSASAQVGILAATACVVMVDRPIHGSFESFRFLALYAAGCLFATALSFTVWRIHPFGSSRAAMRSTYARLADIASDSARLLKRERAGFQEWASHASRYRGQARAAIETTRKALARVPSAKADRRDTYNNLLLALADSEQIFAYLIAVTDACERGHHRLPNSKRAARALEAFAEVLSRLSRALADQPWEPTWHQRDRLHSLAQQLETALGEKIAIRFDVDFSELEPAPIVQDAWWNAAVTTLKRGVETLKANASADSIGARHAARVAVAATIVFITVRLLHLPFGYWATMATLLILQPSIATSWPRSIERAAGSIVGGLLAAAIGLAVHSPVAISLVVFPLVCATMALRPVSYSLFVLFITPTFVLVADFAAPGGAELGYAITRLSNNVLGCVVALLATFLLWPSREPARFNQRLIEAIAANFAYLAESLGRSKRDELELERLRRAAGLASNNAEEVLARLRLEKLDTSSEDRTGSTALALLRRVAGTATRARSFGAGFAANAPLAEWITCVGESIKSGLAGDPQHHPEEVFSKDGLSLLEADAVNQVMLLRRLLREAGRI